MGFHTGDFLTDIAIDTAILAVLFLFPLWRIFFRTGMNPATSLLILIPFAGWLVVVLLLAFARWPNGRTEEAPEPPQ
ncbi:hypothetical protein AAFN88_04225 [Pelagibius sp. CAU 1746]|uniref:hypothetical protein n=1 Tax=Pelagibius sp. CAU 1746 TaxID=3140370 RepID=UPI00325BEA8B